MEIIFSPRAISDIKYWQESGNKVVQDKISQLLDAIIFDPFKGVGKPEPLKHELTGKWSRRINLEHRIVYGLEDGIIKVFSLRGHYIK